MKDLAEGSDAPWVRARAYRRERDTDTKDALLAAAARVFARQGCAATSITDITDEAGLSRPSFYAYFATKTEIFRLIAAQVRDRFLAAHQHSGEVSEDPAALSRASVHAFLEVYADADTLPLMRAIEQHASLDDEVAAIWAETIDRPARRVVRHIESLQAAGLADPVVDPEVIARLMPRVDRLVLEQLPASEEEFEKRVDDSTAIYLRLIGYSPPSS